MIKKVVLLTLFAFFSLLSTIQADALKKCWKKQVKSLDNSLLSFNLSEEKNNLSHSENPWEQHQYNIQGRIWLNGNSFLKSDTLTTESGKKYYSKTALTKNNLLRLNYGDKALAKVTESMMETRMMESCRYSPVLILDYFYKKKIKISKAFQETDDFVYETKMKDFTIKLFIDKTSLMVNKIMTVADLESDDEYYGFGDVTNVYDYKDYEKHDKIYYPKTIIISKLNDKLTDLIHLHQPKILNNSFQLLETPADYKIQKDEMVVPEVTVEKYAKNIHLINLHHCGTRSLMVEFSDFVLVAESPLNSKNGEILLKEVKKIAPNKPIKYFVFGHFHPHYTGGIRPFIHQEARVICTKADQGYIKFIANAPHTINLDSLQLAPKKVKFEEVVKEKTITDGVYEMKIYHIGAQSNHTNDYLIYYFPSEKMIFQDDLIWLSENTTKENLSRTTKGFYQAVKALNLEVNDIIQNWSVFNKEDRMIFKFETIEKIMEE